jgi:hypothetical protein
MRENFVSILMLEKKSAQWYPTSYLGYMHFLNERLNECSKQFISVAPIDLIKSVLFNRSSFAEVMTAVLGHEAEVLQTVLFFIPETDSSILKAPKEFLDDMAKYQNICGAPIGPSIEEDGFEIIEK